MFLTENLGEEWTNLVEDWGRFEAQEQYVEVGRVASRFRPDIVTRWISGGCKAAWRPDISNVKVFEKEFNAWWIHLQPDWRIAGGKLLYGSNDPDGDWDCLRLPGKNGLQSVLAGLFYWGIASQKKAVHQKVWISALKDCHFVILCLLHD
jgi:hypothetical protein